MTRHAPRTGRLPKHPLRRRAVIRPCELTVRSFRCCSRVPSWLCPRVQSASCSVRRRNMTAYKIFGDQHGDNPGPETSAWTPDEMRSLQTKRLYKTLCLFSVFFAFGVGLMIGIVIPLIYLRQNRHAGVDRGVPLPAKNPLVNNHTNSATIRTIFLNNSYSHVRTQTKRSVYSGVSFVDNTLASYKSVPNDGVIEDGIYWGERVENALPDGYRWKKHDVWNRYLSNAVAVKLETGCGRMQNRLVTFQDGLKGCVRYRQNTDQIQGELFSFYLAQILKLPNLAPSAVSVVDLKSPLWENLRNDVASAQWNSNRAIVVTQFIANLGAANIPAVFKPSERHLNRFDVSNMTANEVLDVDDLLKNFVELAQWSDLIVFDYLTANLDRIVNNLYNYQWNVNIMDAPAHNLARKADSDLLVFLDNESGLLHGYRLLKKYEIYHSILLDNLCMFRKSTADVIRHLKADGNVGQLLREMFERRNGDGVKDVLPTLPDKSVKILNERIDRVHAQIAKCESLFSDNFLT